MSDILIRGMSMPKCCYECDFLYDAMCCLCTSTPLYSWPDSKEIIKPEEEKLPNCPLVEVKTPHGDLIDRDYIKRIIGGFNLQWEYGDGVSDCWDAIMTAPTVIEASEVE